MKKLLLILSLITGSNTRAMQKEIKPIDANALSAMSVPLTTAISAKDIIKDVRAAYQCDPHVFVGQFISRFEPNVLHLEIGDSCENVLTRLGDKPWFNVADLRKSGYLTLGAGRA